MTNLFRALFYIPATDPENRKEEVVKYLFSQPKLDKVFEDVKNIYTFSCEYWLENGDIPTKSILVEALKKSTDKALVEQASTEDFPTFNEVKFLLKRKQRSLDREHLHRVLRVHSALISDEKNSTDDIKSQLLSDILDLDNNFDSALVDGNFKEESDSMTESYWKAKRNEEVGNPTGFTVIDNATRGIRKGELWMVSAAPSEGKSMFLINLMWTNAVRFGRNVVYASGEMPRDQIRQWLLARHSQHPKFEGIGSPLGISELRDGTLDQTKEKFFLDTVIPDLTQNDNYGQMQVFQIYPDMTVADVYRALKYYRTQMEIDLFIIDMIYHLKGDGGSGGGSDKWNIGLQENIKKMKQMAVTFNSGEKLAIVSGFQVSRSARDLADKTDGYTLSSLAYTAEAERSADVSLWLLRRDTYKPLREARIGINKNRGGYLFDPFMAVERYENGYISEYPHGTAAKFKQEGMGDGFKNSLELPFEVIDGKVTLES
jgi:replicative DNA helicase